MLVLGTPELERQHRAQAVERTREAQRQELLDQLERDSVTVARDGEFATTSLEAQLGRPLDSKQLMSRLKACNPRFYFERSKADPSKMGIYLHDPSITTLAERPLRFLCGFESGFSPEFSIRHVKTKRVPDPDDPERIHFKEIETFERETRGWRTVLARLLRARLITPKDVSTHFGIAPSRESKNWHLTWRNVQQQRAGLVP